MKYCYICKIEKDDYEFSKNKCKKDGLQDECKKCRSKMKINATPISTEKNMEYKRRYEAKHPEKRRAWERTKYFKKRNRLIAEGKLIPRKYANYTSPDKLRISENTRRSFGRAIRKGFDSSCFKYLGYTKKEFLKHIERKFLPGMTWENYGNSGWHIDHKIPISAFNYEYITDIDFKKCWSLKNLQPLWCKDNLKKSTKIQMPHQPSLIINNI